MNQLLSNMDKHFIYDLAKRYPQILIPIEKDVRQTEEYKNLVLRGMESDRKPQFSFDSKDKLESIKTEAGVVEVITMYQRHDFVHMVQCLGCRCEPEIIPDSTGAMAIFGLNNWDKVRANLENYKDSIIILSSGYYSNVSEEDVNRVCGMNLNKDEWIEKSIIIRKYHELTHFVMRKKYPDDIKAIRDELIADIVGIYCAFGYLDTKMLKLFLGLENDEYRDGGRLQNYEGGQKENIPEVLKMIDDLDNKFKAFKDKTVDEIWSNVINLM